MADPCPPASTNFDSAASFPEQEIPAPLPSTLAPPIPEPEPNPVSSAPVAGVPYKPVIVPPPQTDSSAVRKTSLCSYFRKGRCVQESDCRYAHGEEELQLRVDGTWDPTSTRGKAQAQDGGQRQATRDGAVAEQRMGDPGMVGDDDVDGEGDRDGDGKEDGDGDGDGDGTVTLCLLNAPPWMKLEALEDLLKKEGVPYSGARKRKGMDTAFVKFPSAGDAAVGKEKLEGFRVQGCDLRVAPARQRPSQGKPEGEVRRARAVWEVVTPLGNLPYAEQLEQKRAEIGQALKQLVRKTRKCCPQGCVPPAWVSDAWSHGGMACEYEGIMASPIPDGYRNKCEFTVGVSATGDRTVGFQMGLYKDGVTAVAAPVGCKNTSDASVAFAAMLQQVVATSPLPVWEKKGNKGFWRMLTVREGRGPPLAGSGGVVGPLASCMLVVQINRAGAGAGEAVVEGEMERLRSALVQGAAAAQPPLPLSALLLQDHGGVSNAAPPECPLQPLHGEETWITDHLCGLNFRISPTAFFQVNSACASQLYSLAGDWAELDDNTALFDICCGTGTIGITLANRVAKVVGIEMNASAVTDARKNAELNGLSNCTFVAGKAEDVLEKLLSAYGTQTAPPSKRQKEEGAPEAEAEVLVAEAAKVAKVPHRVVAILDPPRAGLHPTVLRTLRAQKEVRRLVYISCNVQTLVENAVELCAPLAEDGGDGGGRKNGWQRGQQAKLAQSKRRLEGMAPSAPFRPVKAMAVDMFPHTHHCEVVVLFER